MANDPQTPTMK